MLRYPQASLELKARCMDIGFERNPCRPEPGYDNQWAVPRYAVFGGIGHGGKICEEPLLPILSMLPFYACPIWCRNSVRAGRMTIPRLAR